jgi:hypothetical protein
MHCPSVIFTALIGLLAGCHANATPQPSDSSTRARGAPATDVAADAVPLQREAAGGLARAMDLLHSAEMVESFRIDPKHQDAAPNCILGYPILARGPLLNETATQRLKDLILDPRGYNGALWCGDIQPGVAFRFRSGSRAFVVLVCFKCQEWEFWLDGERLGKDWFIGLQPQILRLVQQTFPADKVLKEIQPSEFFGRLYRIDALARSSNLPDEKRWELESQWETKIKAAVNDPNAWYGGGGSSDIRFTDGGGPGVIVLTTEKGHAAIRSLAGVVPLDRID